MVRRFPRLAVVLTLLLAMQWGGAFAHCLGALAHTGGMAVEICTADGIRTLHLDGDSPAATGEHDSCPLCRAGMALDAPAPRLPPAPVAYARFAPPPVAGLPPAPARAPPQQPRAPPAA
jgi:hypothetical protein